MQAHQTAANLLADQKEVMAQQITQLHFTAHPGLDEQYGKLGRIKCEQDAVFHLLSLTEAVSTQTPELFTAYIEWAEAMLHARNIPLQDLRDNLTYLEQVCKSLLPGEAFSLVQTYIAGAQQYLQHIKPLRETFLTKDNPLQDHAKNYLALLLKGERKPALNIVMDLVKENNNLNAVYEQIFTASQHEVGLLWQGNKITVAHEHFCTAATQQNMSVVNNFTNGRLDKKRKMLGCTITGDQHELGIRMVSDLFDRDGWDTYYLGANMPDINIVSAIKEQQVDLLAISVTMPYHVKKAQTLIEKIRKDDVLSDLKIIVGGQPFNISSSLWTRIGADAMAASAVDAVSRGNQLVAN